MTTKYFILTKSANARTDDNEDNQIFFINKKYTYILPQVNLDYYSKYGLFENRMIEWCKQFLHPEKIFLDIGAHSGTYSVSFAGLCKEVHSFEPQRMTYYALCGSIALSNKQNIYAHMFGLGSHEQVGSQILNIVSNDGGGSSLFNNEPHKLLKQESIEIRTLDSLGMDNIGFIKMDVEDNELNVLKGGVETIKKCGCPPFIFESNRENNKLFDYIRSEFGYKIIPIGGSPNMFLASLV